MAKYKGKRISVDGKEYCLGDQIGSGGNGLVFAAATTGSSYEYAIKFLNIKETDPEFAEKKQRFLSELQFCEYSDHPYVLKAVGHGEYNGLLLYVMPRYDQTLRSVIDQKHDYVQLLEYCVQLCEAVKYVHERGIIHRDIKPENIFVNNEGNLVLADFGIAHFCESTLTESGDFLGNRGYAAPEQLIKRNAHHITKACDIYAIGVVMNELFTKQKPAGSQYASIADSIPLLSQFDMLLHRCMRQNPLERPDIDEVLAEIKLIRGDILQDIEWILGSAIGETKLPESEINLILDMASKDIVTAKHIFYNASDDDLGRIDNLFIADDNSELYEVLSTFEHKWNIIWSKVNAREYSVKFRNRENYNQFRKYALEIAKPHYVFEGDVLGLVKINREWDGIVELENLDSFDILNVLSKILGLRAIEEIPWGTFFGR